MPPRIVKPTTPIQSSVKSFELIMVFYLPAQPIIEPKKSSQFPPSNKLVSHVSSVKSTATLLTEIGPERQFQQPLGHLNPSLLDIQTLTLREASPGLRSGNTYSFMLRRETLA